MQTIPQRTEQQIAGHPTRRLVRTVREATFDVFRAHGMTTIFGDPGSTELRMLADYREDFTYVLGLQELVVVGMADGFAPTPAPGGSPTLSIATKLELKARLPGNPAEL